jgi:hypothetical protein
MPGSAHHGDLFSDTGAIFSLCERYRYTLWRRWDTSRPTINFCMLNPSTATATVSDPTVTRTLQYSRRWGYGQTIVTNMYAYRSTDPAALRTLADPIGPDNDRYILESARAAQMAILACGVHVDVVSGRFQQVLDVLHGIEVWCLGVTKDGYPKHPLYLSRDLQPVRFSR